MRCSIHIATCIQVALALCAALSGCARQESASLMRCRVTIDGMPALEVRLVLLRCEQSLFTPILDGVADSNGVIEMKLVDGAVLPDQETELVAMIESIGNGDWQLNKPWSDPNKTPLKVKWPASSEQVEIAIPKKAIRSI